MAFARVIAIFLLFGLASAAAEDLTTLAGRTYKEARVSKVFPDGVIVIHASGTARIKYTDLPPEWRGRYNFDPEKAEAFAEAEAKKQAAFEAQRRAAMAKEQEKVLESQLAARKAATSFSPVTKDHIKQIWLRELAKPVSPLAKDASAEESEKRAQASAIRSGKFDLIAEKLALEQNIRRLTERGLAEEAEKYRQQLLTTVGLIEIRNRGEDPVPVPPRELLFLIPRGG